MKLCGRLQLAKYVNMNSVGRLGCATISIVMEVNNGKPGQESSK